MEASPRDAETERLVEQAMREHGYDHEEAIYAVALEHGEVYGAGDLVSVRRLTPEERRVTGLDHDPHKIAAETRARVAARPLSADKART